jgi:polysaccharide biosynthesis/export protein
MEARRYMKRRIGCILVLGLLTALSGYAEQQAPRELVQYIRDALKAGLGDADIQQNAVKAGWPVAAVTEAIQDALKAGPSEAEAQPKAAPTTPSMPSSEAPDKPGATPATQSPSVPTAKPADPGAEPRATKPVAIERGVPDDYEIGAGDVLQISVWKEPDASVPSVVVRPDGKISMPMLKEVQVSGLTPIQAEQVITEKMTKFITAADVTVIVSAIHSKKIYILGGVKKEGPIPYTYRMTVLQALSEAGGLTDYAKRKKIYVLRHENGRDYQLPFDYEAALKGERMELNYPLMPGDTLVIPK